MAGMIPVMATASQVQGAISSQTENFGVYIASLSNQVDFPLLYSSYDPSFMYYNNTITPAEWNKWNSDIKSFRLTAKVSNLTVANGTRKTEPIVCAFKTAGFTSVDKIPATIYTLPFYLTQQPDGNYEGSASTIICKTLSSTFGDGMEDVTIGDARFSCSFYTTPTTTFSVNGIVTGTLSEFIPL
jgi:hypothetical protein